MSSTTSGCASASSSRYVSGLSFSLVFILFYLFFLSIYGVYFVSSVVSRFSGNFFWTLSSSSLGDFRVISCMWFSVVDIGVSSICLSFVLYYFVE